MTEDRIAGRARALAETLAASGFARLRVRDGDTEIEVRRAPRVAPPSPPASIPEASGSADGAARSAGGRSDVLTSDVVGIVRLARPAVTEGTELDGDRELAFIEVLGIRNPIRSRGAGRVASVLVGDGQPVEYGQPLFAIER